MQAQSVKRKRSVSLRPLLFLILGLIITVIMLFPVYWMIVNSLETNQDIFKIPVSLIPTQITFEAYTATFADQFPHLLTSLIVALGAVVISLVIAIPAAYALAHFRLRFSNVLIFALLLAQMIPAVTLATPMFLIFNKLNLLNSYPGLILADSTYAVPFDVIILAAYMQSLPYELVEAAFIDGTGEWGAFLRIILPLALPGIVTAGLFAFLFAWGDFLYGLTIMTVNDIQPISLSIYGYLGQFNSQWNNLMAVATLGAIPAAILLIVFQRYITSGLSSGALKG
ncbi:sugar ABC transporter permease [Ktedonobacter sp. SOSP1-52]|uniref:carbohydrate ABC transporter permease n=1 Tax=Ktedonobacter sp. SOSP1-52 TaxID=2778366 RepID=UPI0019163D9E|nr:carbohydrate ABC transporter permease [Ktedonobacter sp. SOSP1-52]GHO62704.1 sugar ABC transporter permease [Ktedonobacter sp. SOSP1-52]